MAEAMQTPPAATDATISPADFVKMHNETLAEMRSLRQSMEKMQAELVAKDDTIKYLSNQVSELLAELAALKNQDAPQASTTAASPTSPPPAPQAAAPPAVPQTAAPIAPKPTGAIKKSTAPRPAQNKKPAAPATPVSQIIITRNPFDILGPSAHPASNTDSDEPMEDDATPFTTVAPRKKRARSRAQNSSGERSPPAKVTIAANTSSTSSDEDEAPSSRPPPVLIRDKDSWPRVKKYCLDHGIDIHSAVNNSDALKIFVTSVESYRSLTAYLKTKEIPFNCFQLPEDRKLNVILRGVLESTSEEQIKAELLQKKLPVINVHRLKKGDRVWPLVSVQLERTEYAKTIFDVKSIDGIRVRVEHRHKSLEVPQCRRCLAFRHTAHYCTAKWRCAFCTGAHPSFECRKASEKDAKPVCYHCGGEHRATFRGCPKAPKKRVASSPVATPRAPRPLPPAPSQQNFPPLRGQQPHANISSTGYADAAKGNPSPGLLDLLRPELNRLIREVFSDVLRPNVQGH